MKIVRLRFMALALVVTAVLLVAPGTASAADVRIQVGIAPPPGPVVVERPWSSPYRSAVWIPAHNEWIGGRWVWVHGYYTYPPRRGGYWVPARYRHGYYYPGHWAY
jgi:hypothetical protein